MNPVSQSILKMKKKKERSLLFLEIDLDDENDGVEAMMMDSWKCT